MNALRGAVLAPAAAALFACSAMPGPEFEQQSEQVAALVDAGHLAEARLLATGLEEHAENPYRRNRMALHRIDIELADDRIGAAREIADLMARDNPGDFASWAAAATVGLRQGDLSQAELALRAARRTGATDYRSWCDSLAALIETVRALQAGDLSGVAATLVKVENRFFTAARGYLEGRVGALTMAGAELRARAHALGFADGVRRLQSELQGANVGPNEPLLDKAIASILREATARLPRAADLDGAVKQGPLQVRAVDPLHALVVHPVEICRHLPMRLGGLK